MSEESEKIIRVGSRKSELALIQTKHVIGRLQELYPISKFEIHTMSTIGDRVLNVALPKIGEKSLFTRDLEDALKRGGVDFVVHSLKDLPTSLPPGMAIGAVLEREDPRDALVLNKKFIGHTLNTLPKGSIIGTSSLRRTAQLRRKYPHLEVVDIRGNLNTRLAKLDAVASKFAGIILAQAGLVRMEWNNRISQILEPLDVLYAVGQGALAVECRSNDNKILDMLNKLNCIETTCRILAERSFLKTLGGGCSAPVAVSTNLIGSLNGHQEDNSSANVKLIGAVWSLDGAIEIRDESECALIEENTNVSIIRENEENDEDEPSPRKRSKLSKNEAKPGDNKRNSPILIDDDVVASRESGDAKTRADVQYLIDVHGKLFKRCPYYSLHEKDDKNGNSSQKVDECPLKIPIGQDFMGKCPYVDIEQKVDLSVEGKCPITGKTVVDLERIKSTQDKIDKSNIVSNTVVKCPFSKETSKLTDVNPDNCTFLQKKIKMIDCDTNKEEMIEVAPNLIDDSESLFCGMYKHSCYSYDMLKRCEDLGKLLAKNLIAKGALEVMQQAQNEIHGKV